MLSTESPSQNCRLIFSQLALAYAPSNQTEPIEGQLFNLGLELFSQIREYAMVKVQDVAQSMRLYYAASMWLASLIFVADLGKTECVTPFSLNELLEIANIR